MHFIETFPPKFLFYDIIVLKKKSEKPGRKKKTLHQNALSFVCFLLFSEFSFYAEHSILKVVQVSTNRWRFSLNPYRHVKWINTRENHYSFHSVFIMHLSISLNCTCVKNRLHADEMFVNSVEVLKLRNITKFRILIILF